MRAMIKKIRRLLRRRRGQELRGADLARYRPDMDPEFSPLFDVCRQATMTSVERLYALYQAVEYIARQRIPGDLVECGVWRGGSVMMMALTLKKLGATDRRLHCFDTFEGMTAPGPLDIRHDTGEAAADILARAGNGEHDIMRAVASLDLVQRNLATTGYPAERISYHVGAVESTLPAEAPAEIALLRLDTDWYQSTKHELDHLYPRLVTGGVLIIDDYGFFRGARQATDEYFRQSHARMLLNRIDNSGRIGVKCAPI